MRKHKYSKEFLERTGMNKQPEVKEEKKEEPVPMPQENFPFKAIGMYKLPETSEGTKYVLVEIPYNPETGDVGFVKEMTRDIREDVIDKFKAAVDDLGYFTGK